MNLKNIKSLCIRIARGKYSRAKHFIYILFFFLLAFTPLRPFSRMIVGLTTAAFELLASSLAAGIIAVVVTYLFALPLLVVLSTSTRGKYHVLLVEYSLLTVLQVCFAAIMAFWLERSSMNEYFFSIFFSVLRLWQLFSVPLRIIPPLQSNAIQGYIMSLRLAWILNLVMCILRL